MMPSITSLIFSRLILKFLVSPPIKMPIAFFSTGPILSLSLSAKNIDLFSFIRFKAASVITILSFFSRPSCLGTIARSKCLSPTKAGFITTTDLALFSLLNKRFTLAVDDPHDKTISA